MPYSTEDYIHLSNPEHPESDFRKLSNGNINTVATRKYGKGIMGRMGILKGSDEQEAVYIYLFDMKKWTEKTAQEWIKNKKEVKKIMDDTIILKKEFNFIMPLQKGYDGDDGYYHIQFAISSAKTDLEKDQMTTNALNKMVAQAKGMSVDGSQLQGINIDDDHKEGLKSIIGPVTDSWLEKNSETNIEQVWVDLRVRKEWKKTIKDLVDSGTALGGSVYGSATEVLPDDGSGVRKINDVFIARAALTDTPAAWDTRGTAKAVKSLCSGSMCKQIVKSLKKEVEVDYMTRNDDESYEALSEKIRAAINSKFSMGDHGRYWVRRTWPDAVIAESFDDDKLYEIPYTVDSAGEIELKDPVEVETQYVEKQAKFYEAMFKDINKNRGDNLPENEIIIPEGVDLDKSIAEKIKAQGDKGKEFIKGLLGIGEEPAGGTPGGNPTPAAEPEPTNEPPTGGETVEVTKTMIKKMIDEKTGKLEKKVEDLETENKSLKKRLDDGDSENLEKTKKDLLAKSLELHKKQDPDMTPEQEAELFKEIKADLDTENGVALVKRDIKTITKSLETIPAHPIPFTTGGEVKKSDIMKKNQEAREKLEKRGT